MLIGSIYLPSFLPIVGSSFPSFPISVKSTLCSKLIATRRLSAVADLILETLEEGGGGGCRRCCGFNTAVLIRQAFSVFDPELRLNASLLCVETFQVSKLSVNIFTQHSVKSKLKVSLSFTGVTAWVAFRTTSSTRVSERFAWVRCRRVRIIINYSFWGRC